MFRQDVSALGKMPVRDRHHQRPYLIPIANLALMLTLQRPGPPVVGPASIFTLQEKLEASPGFPALTFGAVVYMLRQLFAHSRQALAQSSIPSN
jgi:hypothetical protein